VDPNLQSRYIQLRNDNATFCADLGIRTPKGAFYQLARSNRVHTPCANASDCSEITWAKVRHKQGSKPYIVAQVFIPTAEDTINAHPSIELKGQEEHKNAATVVLTKGKGPDAQAANDLAKNKIQAPAAGRQSLKETSAHKSVSLDAIDAIFFKEDRQTSFIDSTIKDLTTYFSGALAPISSPTLGNFSSPALGNISSASLPNSSSETFPGGASERPERRGNFFFNLDAECIIYGRTEPDAHVRMGNKTVALREDGTFSLRLALPDGILPLDFYAQSSREDKNKSIRLTLGRTTFVYPQS
jgi:hypothetical protein